VRLMRRKAEHLVLAIRIELGNLRLCRTAWWGWEDSNLQPNDYQPLALSIDQRPACGISWLCANSFKRKLYDALRAMEYAGFSPGITSGFGKSSQAGIAPHVSRPSRSRDRPQAHESAWHHDGSAERGHTDQHRRRRQQGSDGQYRCSL
jgi:hypothetical protein